MVASVTIGIAYISAIRIEQAAGDRAKKKLYLAAAVIIIVGLLAVFKLKRYVSYDMGWLIVPLGVSYYTFSLIGYLADVYYRKDSAEKNILKLALYTLYFPKIMQGPISKFRIIGPKLTEGHVWDYPEGLLWITADIMGIFQEAGHSRAGGFDDRNSLLGFIRL